ncbi:hypothetical protein [Thiohalorhabdus sp.]|uniref:hypothetical protein n=1 Tax=Thiohalorhabdus sp. TaxID=3094134 RepID=UPI002FC37CB4
MRRLYRLLAAGVAVGLVAGCGGHHFQPPGDAPEAWQEAMREEAPGGWAVWGYGKGAATESLAAGRSRAASKARSALAERIDARSGHLREGLNERLVGDGSKELEKTDIRAVVKRAGEIAVNRAEVERRERDADGNWHVLIRTHLRPPLSEAAEERGLSSTAKERLMGEAERILQGDSQGKGN